MAKRKSERRHSEKQPLVADEVTPIRQDAQARHESAALERAISQSAMDAMIVMDHAGCIVDFNPAAETLFGHTRADAISKPLANLIIPPALRKAHADGLAHFLNTGEGPVLGRRVEMTAIRADGSEFPVELSVVYIPESKPPLFTGFIRDITDRKRNEFRLREFTESLEKRVRERTSELEAANAALQVSEQRFRTLLDSAPDAMIVVDDTGQITQINRRTEELFGYARFELVGQPVERLVPERLREIHRRHRDGYFASPQLRPMGIGLQLSGVHKDGTEFPVEVQLSPLILNERTLVMAALRDVTERKQAEATRSRFAAVMENASAAIVMLGQDGTISDWNRGAERLFGYSSAEIVGQNVKRLLPPEYNLDFAGMVARLNKGQQIEDYETVRLHKSGRRIDVAVTASLMDNGPNQAPGVTVILRDIRERKRLEQQVAEVADQERQRWARELHDRLGQEMSVLAMLIAMLKQQVSNDSPQAGLVSKLEATADRTKGELRRFSKGLFPVDVDANGLRVALGELAQDITQTYKIPCRFECAGEVPLRDNHTATQLFMIAREAAINAAKHAKASEIVIRLEDDSGFHISIRDNGVGLPAKRNETVSMGLRIIRYRCGLIGATLQIETPTEGGTSITVTREAGPGNHQKTAKPSSWRKQPRRGG